MFKKPARTPVNHTMKLILPDRQSRHIERGSAPLEVILIEQGFNPLDVIVSRHGTLISEGTIIGRDDEIRIIRISHGG